MTTTLSDAEVERLVYAAKQHPSTPLSSLLGLVDDAKRRALTPRADLVLVERIVSLLRAPPFDSVDAGRATMDECLRLLCVALLGDGGAVGVEVCMVQPGATAQRPAPPGSADDTATRVGCDGGAGRDYHAKTDLRTVWVAQTLLGQRMRTEPVKTRHGDASIECMALLMILHEFAHIYVNRRRAAFAALEALYNNARTALAGRNGGGTTINSGESDLAEFLAESFAYENARIDRK